MKIFLSLCLALVMVLSLTTSSFAAYENNAETTLVKELSLKYNLKDADKISEGVKPIIINSEKDLQEYLAEYSRNISYQTFHKKNHSAYILNTSTKSSNIRVSKRKTLGIYLYLELYGRIKIENNIITRVSGCGMSLIGFSPGIDLDASSVVTSYDISSDKKSVTIYGECDIDHYLMIDGSIKIFTTHERMELNYRI